MVISLAQAGFSTLGASGMDEVYRPALSQPRSGDETMSENCLVKNNGLP